MAESEVFAQMVSLGLGVALWSVWLFRVFRVPARFSRLQERSLLLAVPLVCAAVLFWVLVRYAASDVRDAPVYLFLYMTLGAAWLGVGGSLVLPLFGLSARDDVIERGNQAAAFAISGALLGITLCFAGGNIGDGPGWWVVVFCALLSTGALFVLWTFLDRSTHLHDAVTIDRDPAAGLRLGGFFVGAGLILGRSVAGDWESAAGTLVDFLIAAWPVLVLWGAAVGVERRLQTSPEAPDRTLVSAGLVPALLYAGGGAVAVVLMGPWS